MTSDTNRTAETVASRGESLFLIRDSAGLGVAQVAQAAGISTEQLVEAEADQQPSLTEHYPSIIVALAALLDTRA